MGGSRKGTKHCRHARAEESVRADCSGRRADGGLRTGAARSAFSMPRMRSTPWMLRLTRALRASTCTLAAQTEAEAAARRALEISPTYSGAHSWLATVLLMEGKPEAALTESKIDNPQSKPTPLLVAIYHALRRSHESDAMLARLKGRKLARASLAGAYAYTAQRDEAMDLLEQAFARHEQELTWINYDPLLMPMANEPRFKGLLRKMKLPD